MGETAKGEAVLSDLQIPTGCRVGCGRDVASGVAAASARTMGVGCGTVAGIGTCPGCGAGIVVGCVSNTVRRLYHKISNHPSRLTMNSPSGTTLLPLQPTLQTMQMENMSTPQLFRRIVHRPRLARRSRFPRHHILSTDNTTSPSQAVNFRLRRIRVSRVHVPSCTAILDEVETLCRKGAEGEVQRNDMVDREDAGKDEDGVEEGGVDDEFDGVYGERLVGNWKEGEGRTIYQIDVKRPHALAFPRRSIVPSASLDDIDEVDQVFRVDRQRCAGQDRELYVKSNVSSSTPGQKMSTSEMKRREK